MSPITPAQAAKHLLTISEARKSFLGFVQAIHPDFKLADFQLELIDKLDRLERGTLGKTRMLITMPPRHSKSMLASVLFPTYYMARRPRRHTLAVSYGADLAKTFGRQVRDFAVHPLVNQIFPDFVVSEDSRAATDWATTENGRYFACGLNGSTTGKPANLLIIDDPIKNRSEAESATYRTKLWQYYVGSCENRKEPEVDGTQPIEILIQTRWHPDDLAGRIMATEDWAEEDWVHVNYPALYTRESNVKGYIYDLPKDDPRYLPYPEAKKLPKSKQLYAVTETAALWPERFPVESLLKKRRLDPREFESLYQQNPYIQGGNLIKATWWSAIEKESIPQNFQSVIIAADTAFKTKSMNDYSVLMALGLTHTGDIYILDIVRLRLDYPDLKRRMIMENAKWRGRGLRGIYIEDKASGQSLIQELRKESGLAVIPYKFPGERGSSDKVSRVNSVLPLIEGGRVFVPADALWFDEFIEETQAFPNSKYDDQVDALAIGLDVMSRMGGGVSQKPFEEEINLGQSMLHQVQTNTAKELEIIYGKPLTKNSIKNFHRWGEL